MFHFFPFSLNPASFNRDFEWRNFRNWGERLLTRTHTLVAADPG